MSSRPVRRARGACMRPPTCGTPGTTTRPSWPRSASLHLGKQLALELTQTAFDVCGARAAFRDLELERLYRDVRTFSLHYRDEQYMVQVGQAMLDGTLPRQGLRGRVDVPRVARLTAAPSGGPEVSGQQRHQRAALRRGWRSRSARRGRRSRGRSGPARRASARRAPPGSWRPSRPASCTGVHRDAERRGARLGAGPQPARCALRGAWPDG